VHVTSKLSYADSFPVNDMFTMTNFTGGDAQPAECIAAEVHTLQRRRSRVTVL
jgi:hypothetical protein